jgi:hypothetical protein
VDIKKLLAVEKSSISLSSVPDESGPELAPFSDESDRLPGF